LDTASAYGNSEEVLGNDPLTQTFELATKASPGIAPETLLDSINSSLDNLDRDTLSLYYLHHASDYLDDDGEARVTALVSARESGLISGIAASVYSPEEALTIIDRYPINGLQFPLNVFDHRFLNEVVPLCKEKGLQTFARSLFLQGSLLSASTPTVLARFDNEFANWRDFCSMRRLDLLEGCLQFAYQLKDIDYWVIGVHQPIQLVDIMHALSLVKGSGTTYSFKELASNNNELITPSKWG
jgi:aryl-alcohol dehydrogenase-like predicted oxidoreductase